MRRYTGQRALYEAWSLSRSKPKRNGLLERLRPQLEKLHDAVVNARMKATQSQGSRPKPDGRSPRTEYRTWSTEDESIAHHPSSPVQGAAAPAHVETPASVSVPSPTPLDSVAERQDMPATGRGQTRRRENGGGKSKGKAPKTSSAPREATQNLPGFSETESPQAETPKVEAVKTEVPATAEVEIPPVEASKIQAPEPEPQKVDESPAPIEAAAPIPASATAASEVVEPGLGGTESPRPTSRSILSSDISTGADFKSGRIVDRLKEFRAQRDMQALPGRDAKAYMPVNLRPRRVQVNAGRVEVSLELKYAILTLLGTVALLLMVFAIGRASGRAQQNGAGGSVTITDRNPVTNPAAVAEGNNRIVIAQHADRKQLEPLMQYFRDHDIILGTRPFSALREDLAGQGLSTKGVPKGDGFLLMTANLYNGVDKPGTDGYNAKQKIIELGEKYQPTDGSVPFSRKDVYGLKVTK